MATRETIYRSPEHEAELMGLYGRLLAAWPVPHTERDVATDYGKVHVIEAGPRDGFPVLLLHASSTAAVSWAPNVAPLSERFHLYAIDHIGEAGRSRLDDITVFPKGGDQLAKLYAQIADRLDVTEAHVIGASNGGYVAMSYACRHPERVRRLALLGPMGLTRLRPAAALRMMAVSLFPSPGRADRTTRWAIGDARAVADQCRPWFSAVLQGIASPPSVAPPGMLTDHDLRALTMPVLLLLGTRDNLVGNPSKAARRARLIPDVDVAILDSAHLIGIEQASEANDRLAAFLQP